MKYHLRFWELSSQEFITELHSTIYRPQVDDKLKLDWVVGDDKRIFTGEVRKVGNAQIDLREPLLAEIRLDVFLSDV